MIKNILVSLRALLVLTIITGVCYPLLITGIVQLAFPFQSNGSLVQRDGKVIGSALIGQKFDGDRYFSPRPSATNYDAMPSGGSNLGPTSKALIDAVKARVATETLENPGLTAGNVPVDMVTASGSGLDPDISPDNASIQVVRVAKARGLTVDVVKQLVAQHTRGRDLGFLGEPRVNVLGLNLALDAAK